MRLASKQARHFRWQTVVRLYQAGKRQQQIAELLLISQSSVSRIITRYEQNPAQVIATKTGNGSKKRLSEQALEQVKSWASKNAVEFGFQGQYWTRGRFKRLIKEKFGVDYQLSGVGNLLKSLQVTLQKPMLRDYRQKPEQLAEWKAEKLPAIKKKAEQGQSELAYQDEAGVSLLPSVGYSYAPRGQRPVITADAKNRLKLSLSVVITPQADLYYEVRQGTFNGAAIVRFIKKMKKTIKKRITLIWDGASIHTGQQVKDFLQTQARENRRVWIEKLPAYCPALNPAEQVWAYLKNVLLKNQVSKTLAELKEKVVGAMEIIKKDKGLIKSFFHHPNIGFYANSAA